MATEKKEPSFMRKQYAKTGKVGVIGEGTDIILVDDPAQAERDAKARGDGPDNKARKTTPAGTTRSRLYQEGQQPEE